MQDSDDEKEREYEGLEHDRYLKLWREAASGYAEARKQHFRDQEYFDGDVKGTGWGQWTEPELNKLRERKQPPTVRNVIIRKINSICGVEQRARSEPRALPRTPKDQKSAEVATDALRFLKERGNLNQVKADALLDALMVGYAAVEVGGAEDHVPYSHIEWSDFFFDPRSRCWDFSDARYMGVAKWVDKDVALSTYAADPAPPQMPPQPMLTGDPHQDEAAIAVWQAQALEVDRAYQEELQRQRAARAVIEATVAGSTLAGGDEDYEDRPTSNFGDSERERIFVVDMWHRDPQKGWFRCVFTGAGKLFTEPASLLEPDERGKLQAVPPIKAFSLYVSRNGWRFGEVRNMRPVQDDLNKRLSKSLHLLTVSRVIADIGAVPDGNKEAVRREAARPDAFIEKIPGRELRVEDGGALSAGQMQLAQEARQYLEAHGGANEQLQGESGGATSGRMFLAMQQAGLGALATVFNRFYSFEERLYRAGWSRIQQFWTAPMYVRVTDDKNAARFAAVNGAPAWRDNGMRVHDGAPDPLASPLPDGVVSLYGGSAGGGMSAAGPMPPGSMQAAPPEERGPMLAELDMDIIVDRAPEAATLRAEQFEQIMGLVAAGVLKLPPAAIIELSTLPNKSAILDILESEAQKPDPMQQMMAAEKKSEIAHRDAQTAKLKADAVVAVGNLKLNKRKIDNETRKIEIALRANEADLYQQQMQQADDDLARIYAELGMAVPSAAQNSRQPLAQ